MAQTLTRTFPDGDYPSRLQSLYAAQQSAFEDEQKVGRGPVLNGSLSVAEQLAEEYTALKAESDADALAKGRVVTLKALGRKQWRPLKEAHPPRAGDGVDEDVARGDRLAGVNTNSVEEDLIFHSIIAPTFADRAAFDEWADNLAEGEWNVLVTDAWRLVNVAQFDPKSLPSSRIPTADEN